MRQKLIRYVKFFYIRFGKMPQNRKIQNYINAKKMDIKGTGRSGKD